MPPLCCPEAGYLGFQGVDVPLTVLMGGRVLIAQLDEQRLQVMDLPIPVGQHTPHSGYFGWGLSNLYKALHLSRTIRELVHFIA
jgi:hypothetical protein